MRLRGRKDAGASCVGGRRGSGKDSRNARPATPVLLCFALCLLAVAGLGELYARDLPQSLDGFLSLHRASFLPWALELSLAATVLLTSQTLKIAARLEDQARRIEEEHQRQVAAIEESNRQAQLRRSDLDRQTELHGAAARRFEGLFQGLPVACFTYDADGIVYETNKECERLAGIPGHELNHRHVTDSVWKGLDRERFEQISRSVFSGESIHRQELGIPRQDGTEQWLLFSTFPLHIRDGQVRSAICALIDISDRKQLEARIEEQVARLNAYAEELESKRRDLEAANAQLNQLALTDSLTGVANRRQFRVRLDEAADQANAAEEPLSVVLVDVDHFKQFNDSYGHLEGDKVLARVAEILRDSLRFGDLTARFGGEEFVLLLPNTDQAKAVLVAERLRGLVADAKWNLRPITASFGVATMRGPNIDARTLIEQADSAMYASKSAGRNRVTHWWSVPPDGRMLQAS